MNKSRFRPLWVNSLTAFTLLSSICVAVLLVSFITGRTAFLTNFDLVDPAASQISAGRIFSAVILGVLLVGLAWTCFVLLYGVRKNFLGYQKAFDVWEEEKVRLIGGDAQVDSEVMERLTKEVPVDTRVHAVLLSWQDASPESDARLVLEGQASDDLQRLTTIQTLAGLLVLLGLIGNFFGLSHAVRELPSLVITSAPAPTPPPQASTQSLTSSVGATGITVTETRSAPDQSQPQEADTQNIRTHVSNMAEGLSVVVISSIMGIGGMIFLTLIVSSARASFMSLLDRETTLMAAEIGTRLRPPAEKRFLVNLERVLDNVHEVPGRLSEFTREAARFASDLAVISKKTDLLHERLGKTLSEDVLIARTSYDQYKTSLEDFKKTMVDERPAIQNLVQRTETAAEMMARIIEELQKSNASSASNLHRIQESVGSNLQDLQAGLQEQHRAYMETVTHFEAYARQVESTILTDRQQLERTFDRMLQNATAEARMTNEAQVAALRAALHDQRADIESIRQQITNSMRDTFVPMSTQLSQIITTWKDTVETLQVSATSSTQALAASTSEISSKLRDSFVPVSTQVSQHMTVWKDMIESLQTSTTTSTQALAASVSAINSTLRDATRSVEDFAARLTSVATSLGVQTETAAHVGNPEAASAPKADTNISS